MRTDTRGNHHLMVFDSLDEYINFNAEGPDFRSESMRTGSGKKFYGASDMQEAYRMGREGLVREGIEAIGLAQDKVRKLRRELKAISMDTVFDYGGSEVDLGRYLTRDPECMSDQILTTIGRKRLVRLVIGIDVHCGITTKAIAEHGRALVALAEAIDGTGLKTEIWVDMAQRERPSGKVEDLKTGRQSVRIKAAGKHLDPGAIMFALTSGAMLRALGFNTMHHYPEAWHKPMSLNGIYAYPVHGFPYPEDYPEGSILIPGLRTNEEAGKCLPEILRQLGLLPEA